MNKVNEADVLILEAMFKAGYAGAFLEDYQHEALHMLLAQMKGQSKAAKVEELVRCIKIIKPYIYTPGDEEAPDEIEDTAVAADGLRGTSDSRGIGPGGGTPDPVEASEDPGF